MLDTPVLFLIFNRPETTKQVFRAIREARPRQLFVVGDGPRPHVPNDDIKVRMARDVVADIDWQCEVKMLFRDNNLGCGQGVSEGINWFFDQVEAGIILEDDCLPDKFFFEFCSVMLERYQGNHNIGHVSGNNFQNGIRRGVASYYFSAYSHNWGWASWASRWKRFNYNILDFDAQLLAERLHNYGFYEQEIDFWNRAFRNLEKSKSVDIWDYQWQYSMWMADLLSILPNQNLVENIGFGHEATHTTYAPPDIPKVLTTIDRNIEHPDEIIVDAEADHYTFRKYYQVKVAPSRSVMSIVRRLARRIRP